MQKITVKIESKGFAGLSAENIEKALLYYFSSPTLNVSFFVTEAAQQSAHRTNCKHGDFITDDKGSRCLDCGEYE